MNEVRSIAVRRFLMVLTTIALIPSVGFGWQPVPPEGIGAPADFHDNGVAGVYYAPVLEGDVPFVAVSAIVASDTDCAPDEEGLSHCQNTIMLADGMAITIQNTHAMARYRCLAPGETVSVQAVAPGWIVVTTQSGG
jgi:hypothetical protein